MNWVIECFKLETYKRLSYKVVSIDDLIGEYKYDASEELIIELERLDRDIHKSDEIGKEKYIRALLKEVGGECHSQDEIIFRLREHNVPWEVLEYAFGRKKQIEYMDNIIIGEISTKNMKKIYKRAKSDVLYIYTDAISFHFFMRCNGNIYTTGHHCNLVLRPGMYRTNELTALIKYFELYKKFCDQDSKDYKKRSSHFPIIYRLMSELKKILTRYGPIFGTKSNQ